MEMDTKGEIAFLDDSSTSSNGEKGGSDRERSYTHIPTFTICKTSLRRRKCIITLSSQRVEDKKAFREEEIDCRT